MRVLALAPVPTRSPRPEVAIILTGAAVSPPVQTAVLVNAAARRRLERHKQIAPTGNSPLDTESARPW
jgi:hypothetical protein